MRDGIYVEEDVEIADDADLYPPIFIGRGARIRSGAVIHGPTVIRPHTIIDNRAHIDRSIVWQNVYIGQNVELRGAIIAARSSIGARAVIFEGAVIGDQCNIGEGAVIHPNVKVLAPKARRSRCDIALVVDLGFPSAPHPVWALRCHGSGQRGLDPEFAARLGAAFGAALPQGSRSLSIATRIAARG